MNKQFKFFLTSAAIAAALVGAVSCQKDYSGDINDLDAKISALQSQLSDLQNKINNGEVVTNVSSTADGITVTTNKGTYTIKNGKDGANGTNGTDGKDGKDGKDGVNGKDGSVVTIGENGNWFIDGVDTGLAAAGKDGKDGKDGVDGKDGKDGVNGKDGQNGEYYVPNAETGFFDKYTYDATKGEYVKTATEISFLKPGAITAVWDKEGNKIIISGLKDKDGKAMDPYTITLLAEVKSLVFMPATYVDGVEAMLFENFSYVPQVLKDKTQDTKNEIAINLQVKEIGKDGKETGKLVDADPVPVQPGVLAQYHVNPTNADLSFLEAGTSKGLSFIVVPNAKYVDTRAEASKDFAVTPIFKSFEKGVLTVEVQVTGTPATEDLLSVIALNIEKASGEFVTSDYATLVKQDLDDVVIAIKNSYAKDNLDKVGEKKDAHLRRASLGISAVDAEAYIAESEAWTEQDMTIDEAKATCDVSVKYDGSLDLKTIVAAHTIPAEGANSDSELTEADLTKLGLTWEFAVVKNYKIGSAIDPSKTDQADFVELKDGVFKPKVFSTEGVASIGRTPIIRVALKHGTDVVQYAYIKVFISDKEETTEPFDAVYEFNDKFVFSCVEGGRELLTTVEYMNVNIYNQLRPAKEFHALYDQSKSYVKNDKDGKPMWVNVGTVEDIANDQSQGTHILKWTITADEAWENAGKEVVHYFMYYSSKSEDLYAVIKLVAKVDDFLKAYNVPAADYIPTYWKNEPAKNITYYNVFTPDTGETDPSKCLFQTDINIAFSTWLTTDVDKKGNQLGTIGSLKLADDKNGVISKIEYFFCKKDVEKITKIGDLDVIFEVGSMTNKDEHKDSTELYAKFKKDDEFELVAKITNAPTAIVNGQTALNFIEINKESDVAKKLVNTDALYTFISAKGFVCGETEKPVAISFQEQDHFRANVLRPVHLGATSSDYFVDARDYGELHTFIRIEDLINPYDWRNRKFTAYPNYWDYYGIENVEIIENEIQWDAKGKKEAIPATIIVVKADYDTKEITVGSGSTKKTFKSDYGFLCYRNGNTYAEDFNFYVKVKVTYAWGVIETTEIKVPVHKTEIL